MHLTKTTENFQYMPTQAIIIHQLEKIDSEIEGDRPYNAQCGYMEIGNFKKNENTGQFELKNVRPMKRKSLMGLKEFLNEESKKNSSIKTENLRFKNFIDKHILYTHQDQEKLSAVWIKPSSDMELYFQKALNIPDGIVHGLPALLFLLKDKTLSIFAVKNLDEFDFNANLYKAPFHNVNGNATICMGSAKISYNNLFYWEDLIKRTEEAFFSSKFTHFNDPEVIKGNLNLILKDCIENKKPFPISKLVATKTTLESLKRKFNIH